MNLLRLRGFLVWVSILVINSQGTLRSVSWLRLQICSPNSHSFSLADSVGLKTVSAQIIIDENHDLAVARSSSHADPGLRVAFKCLKI